MNIDLSKIILQLNLQNQFYTLELLSQVSAQSLENSTAIHAISSPTFSKRLLFAKATKIVTNVINI